MNKKVFKEPQIPQELTEVRDAAKLMQAAREEEGEIFRRQVRETGIAGKPVGKRENRRLPCPKPSERKF